MKTIRTLAVLLASVVAMAAVFASAASAHEWRLAGVKLTKSVEVKSEWSIHFSDTGDGNSYECKFEEKGTVGPGAAGAITSITTTGATKTKTISCHRISGCSTELTIEAENLPWTTELTAVGEELRNAITAPKSPEWKVVCKGGALEGTYLCSVAHSTSVKNNASGYAEERYLQTAAKEPGKCTPGGTLEAEGASGPISEARTGEAVGAF